VLRYEKKKGFDHVQADFEKAVELDPLAGQYRSNLGRLLARMDIQSTIWRIAYEGEDGKPRKLATSALKPTPEQMEWAREELGLACELEPENEYYRETFDEFLGMYAEFQSEADTK
jgi:hypothetical protein